MRALRYIFRASASDLGQQELVQADGPEDFIGIAGDFKWTSIDGKHEGILRLQPSGQWWHAVHIRLARAWLDQTESDDSATWEMAESLGSWRLIDLPSASDSTPNGAAVLLSCMSCRRAAHRKRGVSSKLLGGMAPSSLKPYLDKLVDQGQVNLCYAVRWCPMTGQRSLKLCMEPGGPVDLHHDIWSAIRVLGFAESYRQQHVAASDTCLVGRERAEEGSVVDSFSEGSRGWESGIGAVKDGIRIAGLCAGVRCRDSDGTEEPVGKTTAFYAKAFSSSSTAKPQGNAGFQPQACGLPSNNDQATPCEKGAVVEDASVEGVCAGVRCKDDKGISEAVGGEFIFHMESSSRGNESKPRDKAVLQPLGLPSSNDESKPPDVAIGHVVLASMDGLVSSANDFLTDFEHELPYGSLDGSS